MIREMEAQGANVMNLFPLRPSIIPKYIKIDTTSLVNLLIDRQKHGYTKTHCKTKGNLVKMEREIWSFFFKIHKRCFSNQEQRKYQFNYMIETDGVGCSIRLIRRDLFGRTRIQQPTGHKKFEKYIDEVPRQVLEDKKLVGIDPNLSDLLYCVTKDQGSARKLRYTQNQRRKETKSKKYLKLIQEFKQNTLIEEITVVDWEAQLSQYNHKTLVFVQFQDYIRKKNLINSKLFTFYEEFLYRKLRWNGYINKYCSG